MYRKYVYANKTDSIIFFLQEVHFSSGHNIGLGIYPCNPNLEMSFVSEDSDFTMEYAFDNMAYLKPQKTYLHLSFNSNGCSILYDSTDRIEHRIIFDQFTHFGILDNNKKIKQLTLENLRIKEVEFLNGDLWKLIAYDSVFSQ